MSAAAALFRAVQCRLGKWLVVLSLVLATGAHWAILQSLAWVGMAVSYSQSDPLPLALKKTFDGEHPCNLCKFVAEGKKAEKQQDLQKLQTKLDFFCLREVIAVLPQNILEFPRSDRVEVHGRVEAPPRPPPRLS